MSGVRIWMTRYMGWQRRYDLHGLCDGGGLGVECGECVLQEGEVFVERDTAPQCARECGLERFQGRLHLEEVAREMGEGDGGVGGRGIHAEVESGWRGCGLIGWAG